MKKDKLAPIEAQFADLIWEHEPLTTRELSELAYAKLGWKRTTTYTVLKRLSDQGIFRNEGGTVTSLVSKEDLYAAQGMQIIEEAFHGSLPSFLAAFAKRKALTEEEIEQIRKMIDEA